MRHLKAHGSDIRHIGAVAADTLDEINAAVYGPERPVARALTDGEGILLIMRIPAGVEEPSQLEAIQRMVGAATYRRTGVELRTGGVEIEMERGLAVLAFERVPGQAQPGGVELPAGPVSGAG